MTLKAIIRCFLVLVVNLNDDNIIITTPSVQALATPARSRKRSQKRKSSSSSSSGAGGGGGFGKPNKQIDNDRRDAAAHQTLIGEAAEPAITPISKVAASNLFSACSHLQNPQLYKPRWAYGCKQRDTTTTTNGSKNAVIASRDVGRGQVLTLFPIHALGLRNNNRNSNDKNDDAAEFLAYNHDEDEELFKNQANNHQREELIIPLDEKEPAFSVIGNGKYADLFATFVPEKETVPGWLGGRISKSTVVEESNCVALPLPGAAPFCAVVATRDVKEGEEVIRGVQPLSESDAALGELKSILAKKYAREISGLGMHIEMACETAKRSVPEEAADDSSSDETLGPFHQINQQYPGLERIHRDPDIYAIPNFLAEDECDRIIAKARPHLQPCLIANDQTGMPERDPVRTSTNANLPQAEVPAIMRKITNMARCSIKQLEILQVLHYDEGQEFKPHTDGFSGPFSACGFERSTRLATVFCYLNDVSEGGCTRFPELDLDIRPRKGTAVIHFPADVNLREDKRTLHQGAPAVDDKWLLTTWVWKTERTDKMFAEGRLSSLSSDII